VNGRKKKSWAIHHNPGHSNKVVRPSYIFCTAYYGNITSVQYFFSEKPIKALENFARKYSNNNPKDVRLTVLNTIEDIQKVGKNYLIMFFRNETPFHWVIQNNKHVIIKELVRLYKERTRRR